MFRSRFLLTAAVAVVAALALPATSQATFTVTFAVQDTTTNTALGTYTVTDDQLLASDGGSGDSATPNFPPTQKIITNTRNGYQGVLNLSLTTNSNAPNGGSGMPGSSLWETVTTLKNFSTDTIRITITVADQFNSVGGVPPAGGQFGFYSFGDTTGAGVSGTGTQVAITSSVTYDGGTTINDPNSIVLPSSPSLSNHTPVTYFTPTTNAPLTVNSVMVVDLAGASSLNALDGGSANFSSGVTVFAPAPSGAIMLAGALPFVGLLRLRRRVQAAAPSTAV